MACDIHLHVERRKAGSEQQFYHSSYSEFSDREYAMFAKLANVRNSNSIEHLPIRGIPGDITWRTFTKIYKPIISGYKDDLYEEHCYLQEQADSWVRDGVSFTVEMYGHKWCSNPDWHSYNWCTPEEMAECVESIFKDPYGGNGIEWAALATYMKALEGNGKFEVRAVFWFDN
jgi:hypothetical protein